MGLFFFVYGYYVNDGGPSQIEKGQSSSLVTVAEKTVLKFFNHQSPQAICKDAYNHQLHVVYFQYICTEKKPKKCNTLTCMVHERFVFRGFFSAIKKSFELFVVMNQPSKGNTGPAKKIWSFRSCERNLSNEKWFGFFV